jgi:hypothetical protein
MDMSLVKRLTLYSVAFVCGWVMMGLEILGGRILSPDFGSGVFVWGSVISVFLLSLSIGYYLGGWASARWPSPYVLGIVIFLAGLSVTPIAFWYARISGWFADLGWNERYGALAAASTLFLVPSTLLGMVSPYCIRLLTTSVSRAGASAGSLYALSTIGSFLGCLHTAFYLILSTGIRDSLLLGAGVLVGIAVILVIICSVARDRADHM